MPNRSRPSSSRPAASHHRATLVLVSAVSVVLIGIAVLGAVAIRSAGAWPTPGAAPASAVGIDTARPGVGDDHATGEAGGELPSGASVFDDHLPGVARVDADLLEAVRHAARDAEGEGVRFEMNSGWRSPALQEQLLDDAVDEYGSREEAARWVSTPDTSEHVRGEAVDIGDWSAAAWLQEHGAAYGLCQIYTNEAWHYELRPEAATDGCPQMYVDPTTDPRMQG
ncbi:M15 family metallopeptidase [Curtobacterium oceanosedimentum]|uniref:M15 family metallopeptidase n=1 Tax=Curtobacterium oceanosedimentum TaxID=465820 RepID=UPI001CE08EA0|nr:M15 family metallopeptidase [Curtobacterium oceanosedimentum]MCA5924298.1 M15 family metallopeptidase [Curtobacterium oceanosedimentum]